MGTVKHCSLGQIIPIAIGTLYEVAGSIGGVCKIGLLFLKHE